MMDTSRLTPTQRAMRFGLANTLTCIYVAITVCMGAFYGKQVAADGTLALRPPRSDSTSGQWFSHEFGKYIGAAITLALSQMLSIVATSCLQHQDTVNQGSTILLFNFALCATSSLYGLSSTVTSLSYAALVVCSTLLCAAREVVAYEQVERPFHTASAKVIVANMGVSCIRFHSPGFFIGLTAVCTLPLLIVMLAAYGWVEFEGGPLAAPGVHNRYSNPTLAADFRYFKSILTCFGKEITSVKQPVVI